MPSTRSKPQPSIPADLRDGRLRLLYRFGVDLAQADLLAALDAYREHSTRAAQLAEHRAGLDDNVKVTRLAGETARDRLDLAGYQAAIRAHSEAVALAEAARFIGGSLDMSARQAVDTAADWPLLRAWCHRLAHQHPTEMALQDDLLDVPVVQITEQARIHQGTLDRLAMLREASTDRDRPQQQRTRAEAEARRLDALLRALHSRLDQQQEVPA